MLPSARRAELSKHDFDNSYLSRRALAGEGGERQTYTSGRPPPRKDMESLHSRTTAALTVPDSEDGDRYLPRIRATAGGTQRSDPSMRGVSPGSFAQSGASSSQISESESEYSDDGSIGTMISPDSMSASASRHTGIREANSYAGQIWSILDSLDDLVLEVKVNECQCRRLGARLAALKKPMVAVHRGHQTADRGVLVTIKELVTEAQHFMQRFLDPDWWRKYGGHKEDSEMFRELTFRLGFLMQAPAGFQEQSQEEDYADRLKDNANLQMSLEEKLRTTRDERTARQIAEVLRRVRARESDHGSGGSAEIDFEALNFDERSESFGSGGFGTVSLAMLGDTAVSVKTLNNQNLNVEALEDLRKDVEAFYEFKYDFVVRMVGASTVRPNICLVYEHAPRSLFDALHGRQEEKMDLSIEEKSGMLFDVARGLQFLHIKKIVHGYLKSTNVLVFDERRCKLCDFGLLYLRQNTFGNGDTVPATAWTAPEVLDDEEPSRRSDVYSFGVLTHEVLTERVPFAGKSVAKVITAVVAKGHRPGYLLGEEDTFPPGLLRLIKSCWAQESEARPRNLDSIVTDMGHIVNALGGDPRGRKVQKQRPASDSSRPSGETGDEFSRSSDDGGGGRRSARYGNARESAEAQRIRTLEEEIRRLKQEHAVATAKPNFSTPFSVDERLSAEFTNSGRSIGGANANHKSYGEGVAPGMYAGLSDGSSSGAVVGDLEERRILRQMYTTTQGPAWFEQTGWDTNDADLSRWYGVVVGDGGHVTAIQLGSNNLQGQIPRDLAKLSRLKTLILSDNKLEGPIPAEFGQLNRLVELNLSMNDLTGAIPMELAHAAMLERLHLQCNGLQGNIPYSLTKLHNLKIFVVDWAQLSSTHPFKQFRKASPPITEAEAMRAASETRAAAKARARLAASAAVPTGHSVASSGYRGPSSQQPSPGSTGVPATHGLESGTGGQASIYQTPHRKRFGLPKKLWTPDGRSIRHPGGGDSRTYSIEEEQSTNVTMVEGPMTDKSGLAQESSMSYVAPTAPYEGNDGLLGKARAKARASAPPPRDKLKNAFKAVGKTFKEIVGADLHPGFSDDSRLISAQKPPPKP